MSEPLLPVPLAQIDWWQHIDSYCERADPSFWSEPLNAWSNAAFWIGAAVFACWLVISPSKATAQRAVTPNHRCIARDLWLMNALLIGIGVASFCFHTYAVRWAALMDVGFIVLWVYFYLGVSARRVLRWRALTIAAVLAMHLLAGALLIIATQWFLMSYLPTAIAAYALAIHASRLPLPGRRYLWGSAIVFTFSMVMAGIDAPLCEVIPTGTHFLWHILNAVTLTLASIGLAQNLLLSPCQHAAAAHD